ncbi:hypothetical protein N5T66_04085 [Aliarcobacter cryaerophilus]|uniref:hypothetical protein n=1 Tax=Aliarcobacter cryaerophilus TaxID=28198 RepID=UPI0021B4D478|nr:hypothetical protein [Aliarcobacter cryaerophilus]MCT7432450.1 hypothetical protein [Aliarcobacter cryaerophilus]
MKGQLKPKEWFLENGWEESEKVLYNEKEMFAIEKSDFGKVLIVERIPPNEWDNIDLTNPENEIDYSSTWFESLED